MASTRLITLMTGGIRAMDNFGLMDATLLVAVAGYTVAMIVFVVWDLVKGEDNE